MAGIERLTTGRVDGSYDTFDPIDLVDNEYTGTNYEKVLKKLGEYEDLEERGLLLRLPCKVGDYAWDLISLYRFEIVKIELTNGLIWFRCGNKGTDDYACFSSDDIGGTWSLTEPKEADRWHPQAEAEAALERMK